MFVTFLKFAENRVAAPEFMTAHNEWIAQGFTDGAFLCVGSLQPAVGGAILAPGGSRASTMPVSLLTLSSCRGS